MIPHHVLVKDYIWEGNFAFGSFYKVDGGVIYYIFDDGDIYSEDDLKQECYQYILLESSEIIDAFKGRFEAKA